MPNVLASGYLVSFIEWACIETVNPHIDCPREQTVGTHERFAINAETFNQKIEAQKPDNYT